MAKFQDFNPGCFATHVMVALQGGEPFDQPEGLLLRSASDGPDPELTNEATQPPILSPAVQTKGALKVGDPLGSLEVKHPERNHHELHM